jgi:hypothetical protein
MTADEQIDEAHRMFERWRTEHDPDGVMDLLDAVAAYSEWAKKNSIERYLDATQGQ